MKNIEIQIVDRIAQLRKNRGLKLIELAARANLSPSQISRIEHHQVSPPLSTLSKIAGALGVRVEDFFKGEEENLSILIHRSTDEYVTVQKDGKEYDIPFYKNIYRLMEPVIIRVPRELKMARKMTHEGEEFMFVIEGQVNFCYGRDTYVLKKHDSVYFRGRVPHCTFNESDKEARVVGIMTSRENLYNGVMFYRFLHEGTEEAEV